MRFALELKHCKKESILPQLPVFYSSEEKKNVTRPLASEEVWILLFSASFQ